MRKPRGGQILANRVIGPREVLGGGDRRVPAKGRGRTEPHRGRSGASWIWSTPLHTGASEGEFRSGYALTPSPSHSKNISLFTERRTSERTVSEDGYSSFLFNPLWGFPVVAAGILFVVDHPCSFRSFPNIQWKDLLCPSTFLDVTSDGEFQWVVEFLRAAVSCERVLELQQGG